MKKKISIVTGCYNEEENVELLVQRIREIMENKLARYDYEHIFIDNDSEDKTVEILKRLAVEDKRVKIIVNSRNFGHIRSPMHALFNAAQGNAVIAMAADFQDPPEMIPQLVEKWEEGYESVLAIKAGSEEKGLLNKIRESYYSLLYKLSEVEVFKNFTGFGLYDEKVIIALRQMRDPYPFLRGMIAEVGYRIAKIPFNQPIRLRGVTKNNFYTLYDLAVLGIINNSKVPLRLAVFISIIMGSLSLFIGIIYFIAKLLFWSNMEMGIAPLLIGASFSFSVLLFFIGILGEYIGMIYTQILNRPLVFEKERINFDASEA